MYAVKNFDLNNNDSIFKIFSYLKGSNFAKFNNNYSDKRLRSMVLVTWEISQQVSLKMRN